MLEENYVLLSPEVFRLIRDLLSDYCGIYFDDNQKYKFEHRLFRRLKKYHIKDYREYYRFLKYSEESDYELREIMDILTVNETYFFREPVQLSAFSEEILPELKEKNKIKRQINIWSAGCSTGEEPYTIAMYMIENGGFKEWDLNIFGSDISQRVLRVAREGVYTRNSFRATDPYFIGTYFQQQADGNFRISDEVKKLVNFGYLNLLDPFRIKLIGRMDVIFCRNVLIYFNYDARKKVIENFYEKLTEEGYLLLGHAESLINISTAFAMKHLRRDIVYQKPERAFGERNLK